jgi:hypothetical protein
LLLGDRLANKEALAKKALEMLLEYLEKRKQQEYEKED